MMRILLLTTLLLTGCQNWRDAREIDRVLGLPINAEYQNL